MGLEKQLEFDFVKQIDRNYIKNEIKEECKSALPFLHSVGVICSLAYCGAVFLEKYCPNVVSNMIR
jgi:hypothetical protein